ncbi:hypothetical protein EDD21DRAFT_364444 [Dissophora ornata]|nr:hypothetical protein EDD21DRAFT_364444 [Dissophora ornata]
MGHVASASGATRYWNEDRTYRNGNKKSQQSTIVNTNTATNSIVSSSEGHRLLRDELQAVDTRRRRSVVTTEWSSDEEDLRSESTSRSNAQTPTRGRSRVDVRLVSRRLEADNRPWQLEKAMISSDVQLNRSSGLIAPDEGELQEQPTPSILRRLSLPLNGLVTTKEALELDPDTMDWGEEGEEDCPSSSHLALPSSGRPLRRTTQKRDNRASWMTYSSTNSSIFGAVLSQGHLPPSQAIKESSDVGNVDRFMERLYSSQTSNGTPEPTKDGPETPHPQEHGMRRKSAEAIHDRDPVEAARFPGSDVSGIKTMGADGAKQEFREDNDIDGLNTDTSLRRSRTLAQHPHRQTVPIMHLHYHHHYLQHRQSESLLHEYPQQRRHSVEVQSMGSWVASSRQQQKERKSCHEINMSSTATHGQGSCSRTLLEGADYAAALQETQRQVQLLISQDNNNGQSKAVGRQVPQVSLQSLGRHQGSTRPRPLAAFGPNSGLSGSQTRSCSDPHLLQTTADLETATPLAARPVPKSNPVTRTSNVYRMPSPMHYPMEVEHQQYNRDHNNIYSQQRSPMNPRFQSIISSTREFLRPPPSIVLQYRSEQIAQQLCLIEREHLNQIPWYELVNAGWKKKPSDASVDTPTAAATEDNSGASKHEAEGSDTSNVGGAVMSNTLDESDLNPQAAPLSKRKANPWPLSRSHTSQTARTHTQRFAHQGHTKDSPSVTQLVDRFNLMCHWVSSEILRTTDLDLRVKVVEKFIRIAHTCYNHSNFSSLTQIMLGLQNHEVSRLSQTWARVRPTETRLMQDLEEFTSMFHNWKHLRNAMKSIADEWGGATGTGASSAGQEGSTAVTQTTASAGSPGSSGKHNSMGGVGANLFSKMAGKDKEKEKDKDKNRQQSPLAGSHPRHISHNHSSSFGKSSGNLISGQVFPSLVSSLTKDKDKDKEGVNVILLQQQQQQQNQQQQQPHGGCIPFLAVYLSDLLYNTELPSYIESKTSTPFASAIQQSHPPTADTSANQLPNSSQSAASTPYSSHSASSVAPSAAALASYNASPPPSMVNMHKHRTIATIIKRILTFRTMANRYPFVKETDVYDQLMAVESFEQADMERMSELCEERASSSALASPVFAK